MKRLVLIPFIILLVGCAGSLITIDGNLDDTEAALVRVSVGVALTAKPELVIPAYEISSALLKEFEFVSVADLNDAVLKEIDSFGFTQAEEASTLDLLGLCTATVASEIGLPDMPESQKVGLAYDVLKIVNESARARGDNTEAK